MCGGFWCLAFGAGLLFFCWSGSCAEFLFQAFVADIVFGVICVFSAVFFMRNICCDQRVFVMAKSNTSKLAKEDGEGEGEQLINSIVWLSKSSHQLSGNGKC